MKTVAGNIVSTKPVSISKAASILSKFVSADTGASQTVSAYLRRASVSFNELAQLHKELKPHRRYKTSKSEVITEDENPTGDAVSNQLALSRPEMNQELIGGVNDGVEGERRKHKKKKKGSWGNEGELVQGRLKIQNEEKPSKGVESGLGVESERKKHKKKRGETEALEEDNGKMGIEEDGNVGTESETRKHKKISNSKENGDGIVIEEGKEKKKRKSGDVEEGREPKSEDSRSKKKKRRKLEGQLI